ncbi:MAG: hypothetical protein N7Q72_02470, partial [Spiroplasma sp. Tabriz.8]|nr:hypothetical protein [Spiroplasma sp. Tabriz.8]
SKFNFWLESISYWDLKLNPKLIKFLYIYKYLFNQNFHTYYIYIYIYIYIINEFISIWIV